MSNELQVIDESMISVEAKTEINEDIDRIIEQHKNNRQVINKLVFESVAAMTEADDAQAELSNKGWFKRRLGSITGSNSRLQDRINNNRAEAMYASQRTLQKLAEQNLMTFDLIAAVNNKLNASLIKVNAEFENIYKGLAKFFKTNRSELARLEARLEKVERNVGLLNWQTSIEYQEFEGVEYADLDDVSKIVCLVRDFYDITKGEWTNSDLLILKSAMRDIDISPKDTVNYFEVMKGISYNGKLKEYMLDSRNIQPIEDPSYLLSLGCLKKFESLNNEEDYVVDTIVKYVGNNGIAAHRENICEDLTAQYLANKAYVNVDMDVEFYDLILDLLYNIRQARAEQLLLDGIISTETKYEESVQGLKIEETAIEDNKPESIEKIYLLGVNIERDWEQAYKCYQKEADLGNGDAYAGLAWLYEKGKFLKQDYEKAYKYYRKAADFGSGDGYAGLGFLYEYGFFVQKNEKQAVECYLEGEKLGSARAMNNLAFRYKEGNLVNRDYTKVIELYEKASDSGMVLATRNLGKEYILGEVVEKIL